MDGGEKKRDFKRELLERLHDPTQLRVFITLVVVLVGYGAIYLPLNGTIEDTRRKLGLERKKLELAREVDHLRAQHHTYHQRLPEKSDANEWVQYVLAGIRRYPVKLINLDTEPMKEVGPYRAVALRIELEGGFQALNTFLHWLETNERLLRIDAVKLEPHRNNQTILVMHLTVLGVMGSTEKNA